MNSVGRERESKNEKMNAVSVCACRSRMPVTVPVQIEQKKCGLKSPCAVAVESSATRKAVYNN